MVLDDESLSQSPTNTETWDSPDPTSPQAALFPNKLDREYLHPPNAFYLYTRFLGPQLWEHRVLDRVTKHLEMAKGILRRNPTQDEINAFVHHTSREVNMSGLGLPIGLAAGFAHTNFFLRRKLSLPGNVPVFQAVQRAWPTISKVDRRALLFQAAIRTSFWLLLSLGNFQGFATYQFTLGLGSDERLGSFREAVKKYTNARMQRLEGNTEQARQRREMREAARHTPATAVAEEYPQPDYGRGRESPSPSPSSSTSTASSWVREQKQADFTDSFFKDDHNTDDASPVAYELQNQQDYNKPTNSWERIREERAQKQQQQMMANSPAMWRNRAFKQVEHEQQQSGTPSTDYASEERSRQQERDAAQREFDQMLDAERQLSQTDSSGSFGDNKGTGWRRW
ncbi:hypothetical protein PISL3812_01189 [Talaromyces islandicus]|uniref:Uncharacterized protein n=1 Tax=Talaromyces islandicus TaxID=28573 RepID=A0A0U1LLG2_TALIS|nr:hypothetical protein PISL3812_01189 [Talaromyces islandicus]